MNLILTYFDQIYGPTVYWSNEEIEKEVTDKIRTFIDLDLGETFFEISMVEKNLKTINLYIEVPSDWGRGKKEMAMLTIIVDHNFKASLFQDLLKEAQDAMKSSKEMYKGLYKNDDEYRNEEGVKEKYQELTEILKNCVKQCEEMLQNASIGTLLLLGLGKVGKTTILERIKKSAFNPNTRPTLATTLMEAMIGSYNFKIVDVSGQKALRYQWWTFTANPDAIIFVLDINETGARLEETKEEFQNLTKRFDAGALSPETPVLICANKIDLHPDPKLEVIEEMLELNKSTANCNILLTSAKTGEGINDGFMWLVNKLIQFS